METPIIETEKEKVRRLLAETKAERERKAKEGKDLREKEKEIKEKAKKAGIDLNERKPSRAEIFAEVISSPFLSVPRTVEEIDSEVSRVGLKYNVKENSEENRAVRKLLFPALYGLSIIVSRDGKVSRFDGKAKKIA